MSYYIEQFKRVVTFPFTAPPGQNTWRNGECALFLTAGGSNNVHPRHNDWDVCALSFNPHAWAGEIQLPKVIWEMGYSADGGMIKPKGRDQSGLAYVKAWKQAVTNRVSMVRGDELLWHPRISIWHWQDASPVRDDNHAYSAEEINQQGEAIFSPKYSHLRPELHGAFRRLFPEPLRGSHSETSATTLAALCDAVFLWDHREHLPLAFGLCHPQGCAFLEQPQPQPTALLAA